MHTDGKQHACMISTVGRHRNSSVVEWVYVCLSVCVRAITFKLWLLPDCHFGTVCQHTYIREADWYIDHKQFFNSADTPYGLRGHEKKLAKDRSRLDSRKFFFSQRVVNGWNNLPAKVVNSESVNSFKNAYDHYYCKDMDNRSWSAVCPSTYKYKYKKRKATVVLSLEWKSEGWWYTGTDNRLISINVSSIMTV